MPVLDSFKVDHTKMDNAPFLRVSKVIDVSNCSKNVIVYDFRFVVPNKEKLPEKGLHTYEHLFADYLRRNIKNLKLHNDGVEVIDISPMGCRTGFYGSFIVPKDTDVDFLTRMISQAWVRSAQDIFNYCNSNDTIPEANKYQCGSYRMHSLEEAKEISKKLIEEGISIVDNDDILLEEYKE